MKAHYYFLCLAATLSVLGCTHDPLPSEPAQDTIIPSNYVSRDQVVSYLNKLGTETKGNSGQYSLESRSDSEGNVLMYIVNFNGNGWKILSADNRTPAILAEGDRGSFSLEEGSPGLALWMELLSRDMAKVIRSRDEELLFSREAIASNKTFWDTTYTEPTRNPPAPEYEGYWITHTTSETFVSDSLEHMVPHWDQLYPYNTYAPLKSWSTTVHKPAGCVAVAGAEVLYYLHNKIGVPANAYGTCSWVNNERVYGNASSSNWSAMSYDYSSWYADKEAILIAKVGDLSETTYSDTSSAAFFSKLRTSVFPDQGISCQQHSYQQDTVKRYLNMEYPVLITASDQLIPVNGRVHCFVIDGYKKTYIEYTHCHEFIPADPETIILPGSGYESYYTYSYTSPEITAIKINWGWWTQWRPNNPLNDGWYSLTANWVVENGDIIYDYNYNVSMIYNFTANQ